MAAIPFAPSGDPDAGAQRWLLRRVGYPCDGRPNVMITYLGGGRRADNDPYGWNDGSRTFPVAHRYIIEHWAEIRDGDVIDVEFILGETTAPKPSERVTVTNISATAQFGNGEWIMQKKTYSIVGTNHTKKEAFIASLKPGKPVLLVREPRNKFDPCAVAVYIDGEKVGYVPRSQNRVLASFIDQIGQPWEQPVAMAQDSASATVRWEKTLPATFTLSPNSAFPLVEV